MESGYHRHEWAGKGESQEKELDTDIDTDSEKELRPNLMESLGSEAKEVELRIKI